MLHMGEMVHDKDPTSLTIQTNIVMHTIGILGLGTHKRKVNRESLIGLCGLPWNSRFHFCLLVIPLEYGIFWNNCAISPCAIETPETLMAMDRCFPVPVWLARYGRDEHRHVAMVHNVHRWPAVSMHWTCGGNQQESCAISMIITSVKDSLWSPPFFR
jgi:hypothetical protein